MTLRNWWNRLFARTTLPSPARRPRQSAHITLETLPDRVCPSALAAADRPEAEAWVSLPDVVPGPAENDRADEGDWVIDILLPVDLPDPPAEPSAFVGVAADAAANALAPWRPLLLFLRPVPTPSERPTPTTPATGSGFDQQPTSPPGQSTAPPANVAVVALSPAPGERLTPDTPAFRIVARPVSGPIVVPFTLAAHTAAGTTAAPGAVTLRADSPQATVTPRAVFAANPDVLTVVLPDTGGPARSATVFVIPVQHVHDPVLMEAHRQGKSAEAFDALARRHGPAVNRAVLRIVGNRTDAQDVSQFVLTELAQTRATFPGTLTGWLRTVSRNAALAFLRAKRRRRKHEQRAAKVEQVESPPAVADDSLTVALDRLPAELGQAVRLRYLDGYTQHEAAAIAGVPRGTLSRRAAEGVKLLRDLLEWEPLDGEQPADDRHSG
jgi:RNA polymerase sigma-70 factor (ECF subfamily)